MGTRDLINKFTSGELDPKFIAEVDYDGYHKAGRKLRNVICLPQGGVTRRFGTIYQDVMVDGITFISNQDNVRLISYEHQNDELYDIIIRADVMNVVAFDIYLLGVFQTSVPAPALTYTQPMIREIRWVKDYDRLIILHKDVRPYELRRIAVNNWEILPITFQFFPTYDFSSSDNPATLPTPNVPYTSPTVTFTPNAMHATMLTANMAVYTSNHVGGVFLGNAGVFRITAVNGAGTVATGYSLEDFTDTTPIIGPLASLLERAWNDGAAIAGAPPGIVRGWPSRGCFYQSRLVMGGSPALPGIVFASVTKAYYDFDDAEGNATDGWGVELGVTGNDILTDILATKSLVLLGNKGPASTSILIDTPTTPTNAFLNTQGSEGSRNMNSVIIDNQVVYGDRAGNTIWSMSYEIPDTGYNISNASILSTQLIRGPRWADIFDPDDVDGRYYLLVNSDGSMAVYNTIRDENIKAWTLAQTTGEFTDVACVANQAKVLTKRRVNVGFPLGQANADYTVDTTFNAFRNITASIDAAVSTPVFMVDGDYLLIGNQIPFLQIQFMLAVVASASIHPTFEFLDNTNAWEAFIPTNEFTNGFTNSGNIGWTQDQVSDWLSQPIDHTTKTFGELVPLYWLRIKRVNSAIITNPVIQSMMVDSEDRIYLESLDFAVYMDAQILTTSDGAGIVTGLNHLEGQNAYVFVNDFPIGNFYIPVGGQIDVKTANANVRVGLDYKPSIIPMPTVAFLQNGLSVYEPTKIEYMYVDFFESLGIVADGKPLPETSPGAFMANQIPEPQTSYYKIPTYNGWDARVEIEITQSYPAPMNLLAVSYTVEVSP